MTTSAARAGILNLSTSLSKELAPDGIRVNSVCLGLVDTGQWERRYAASGSPFDYAAWQAELAADRGIALGRLGNADEVAYAITTLLFTPGLVHHRHHRRRLRRRQPIHRITPTPHPVHVPWSATT